MAKGNRNRKAYTSVDHRRKIERLLEDEEVYTDDELMQRKRRIAASIRKRDAELEEADAYMRADGVCPYCHCYLTTTKECIRGCR